jgi:hypothetical protein
LIWAIEWIAYIILVLGHSRRKKQTKEKKNFKFFFFKLGLFVFWK